MSDDFHPDEDLCLKYARFAAHMVKWQFTIIYWTMFVTNLVVLFLASWTYIKAQETLAREGLQPKKRRNKLRMYIFLCLGCVMASTVIVVMEAFALMALEFCDGEDLMSLYWSTWTMIQVGSLIAILGVILALMHTLRNRQHPPWALALGTPVLVIAGFLHLFHDCTRKRVKNYRRASKARQDSTEGGPPISQANTIQANPDDDNDAIQGEFIGFTIEGGPIVRFNSPSYKDFPENTELLGRCESNRPIVAYRKNSIRFINEPEKQGQACEAEQKEQADPLNSV